MNLAESGKVSTIIVKDMSRLERNYLMVRQYTEMTFPSLGIRFIAINDGVDTLHGENDMAPFNNLFNDFLAKDTSRKIRAVKKAQAERGECISSKAPYGYRKNPENPKKLVVDGESGRNVQMIFRLCAEGLGPNQIAKKLKGKQILTPPQKHGNTEPFLGAGLLCGLWETAPPEAQPGDGRRQVQPDLRSLPDAWEGTLLGALHPRIAAENDYLG